MGSSIDLNEINAEARVMLQEVKLYRDDWDGDGAPPFNIDGLETAEVIINKLSLANVKIFDMGPVSPNELDFELRNGEKIVHLLVTGKEIVWHQYLNFPDSDDSVREYRHFSIPFNQILSHLKWLYPDLLTEKMAA